ncbi:MAG: carbohydrate ABC transporter permease [Oscillospiraceae bacterium]|jgi:multiple sugar transport system permease protein|nr:carbohydrate ABC transporter permease [Oscillospiraceae bacterium]
MTKHVEKLKTAFAPGSHRRTTAIKRVKKIIYGLFFAMLFFGIGYVLVYPLIYIFTTAIKSTADMLDTTTVWIAKRPTWTNFPDAWGYINYPRSLFNTLQVTLSVTALNMAVCSTIGYGFARFRFRERGLLFALVIFTLVVPPQVILLPNYLYLQRFDLFGIFSLLMGGTLKMTGTPMAILLPAIFGQGLKSGLFIYIFRQFYRGMPTELEEAGYIDGCGTVRTYLRIMLPNAMPAFVTVGLLSFVWHWSDVFGQSQYLDGMPTLSVRLVGITTLITRGAAVANLSYVTPVKYAGVALVILPLIVLYLVGQRFFVQSVERSGIVG